MKEINYDQGIYVLEMVLSEESQILVGKLGNFEVLPGYYYYVGSAQQNLGKRIERHLGKEKTLRWHIDYLLERAEILQVYVWPGEKDLECLLGEKLQTFPASLIPIPGFGSSDCKCTSHLFCFSYRPNLANLVHVIKVETGIVGGTVLDESKKSF